MSRSASRDTARVGKGWPTSGYENHCGLLQKQKMHLFLPPHQLPPQPAWQISYTGCLQAITLEETAPVAQLDKCHCQALVTTPTWFWRWVFLWPISPEPIKEKVQARACAVSLVASGTEVVAFNVFADIKRKYKPGLVL